MSLPEPFSKNLRLPSTQPPLTTSLKHYRTSMFIGTFIPAYSPFETPAKTGLGLLIQDNSNILFGNYDNGQLCGQYAYISENVRMFGRVSNENVLEGFQVVRVIEKKREDQRKDGSVVPNMTLWGNFKNGEVIGQCVVLLYQCIYVCNCGVGSEIGELEVVSMTKNTSRLSLPTVLKHTFPYITTFQIVQFISNIIQLSHTNRPLLSKYHPICKKLSSSFASQSAYSSHIRQSEPTPPSTQPSYSQKHFIGYSTLSTHPNDNKYELGFIIADDQVIKIGQFINGELYGIGKSVMGGRMSDGEWAMGGLNGIGVEAYGDRRDGRTRKWKYGVWRKNANGHQPVELFQEGNGWPQQIVKKMRSSLHMKSLHFDPDYCQISLSIPIKQLQKLHSNILKAQFPPQQSLHPNNLFQLKQNTATRPLQPKPKSSQKSTRIFPRDYNSIRRPDQSSSSKRQQANYYSQTPKQKPFQFQNKKNKNNLKIKTEIDEEQVKEIEGIRHHRVKEESKGEQQTSKNQFMEEENTSQERRRYITEMKEFQSLLSNYKGNVEEPVRVQGIMDPSKRTWKTSGKNQDNFQQRQRNRTETQYVSQFQPQWLPQEKASNGQDSNLDKNYRSSFKSQTQPVVASKTRQNRANTLYTMLNEFKR